MSQTIKTTIFLATLTGLFVALGHVMGGSGGALMGLIFAAVMNLGAYWFSDRIVIAMYRAKEVGADHPLHRIVSDLVLRAGLPAPKVYVIPQEAPNAFATGRSPRHASVAATEGILKLLSREELAGVMAHELAHVKNRDTMISTIAATLAGAISYMGWMLQYSTMFGGGRDRSDRAGHPALALLMVIVAPLAAMLIQMAISRSREFQADAVGARISGQPHALASALRKLALAARQVPMRVSPAAAEATSHMFIVNPFAGQRLMSLFSTHPPMAERIRRLENMGGTGAGG